MSFLLSGRAFLTAAVLALAIVLGGGAGKGHFSDAVLELLCLPLLGFAIYALWTSPPSQIPRAPVLLLVGAVLLLLLHLLPLPPWLWPLLPGRAQFAKTYMEAEIPLPWLPLSLGPAATWDSLFSTIPGIAVFLSVLFLNNGERRKLSLLLIGLAFISVLLGLLQIIEGPESSLRFYAPHTTADVAVGFFANRNQYAALLYSVMPLTAAWAGFLLSEHRLGALPIVICIVAYGSLMVGLASAMSRAGLLIGLLAGAGSVALVWSPSVIRSPKRSAAIGMVVALCFAAVTHFGLLVALGKRETLTDEGRVEIFATTVRAASSFFPLGSGFGTFVPVFAIYEKTETVTESYTNRAHNDWIEILLEGGLPAATLVVGFLIWYIIASIRIWSSRYETSELLLPRAASIIILLLLLHSIVDFPLRTQANLVVFAFACALLACSEARPGAAGRPQSRS